MALKGDLRSIKGIKQSLRALPVTVAADISKRAAPAFTSLTRSAFDGRTTVYGDARPTGVDGNELSLVKSGATQDALRFISVGTIVRCVLPTKWARYLIGKYGVLPNGALPVGWSRRLSEIAQATELPK
jgi:hypothetical protein